MTATTLPRRAIAVLLIAAAALFVIGVLAEGDEDTHTDEPEATQREEATEAASGEADAHEASEASESQEAAEEGEEDEEDEEDENVLGLDLESPLLVGAAVVASILLAGLTLARRDRRLLLAVAGFAGAFAVLDAAEVVHQLDEDNTGLALLATVIAVLHAGAALLALQQASPTTPTTPQHQPAST